MTVASRRAGSLQDDFADDVPLVPPPPPSSPSVTSLLIASGVYDAIDITNEDQQMWNEFFEKTRKSRTRLLLRDGNRAAVEKFVKIGGGILLFTTLDKDSSALVTSTSSTVYSLADESLVLVTKDSTPSEIADEVRTKYLLNDQYPIALIFSGEEHNAAVSFSRCLSEIPTKMIALRNVSQPVPPEYEIAHLLKTRKHRVSLLESTTGGLLSSRLLAVPGASAFFISGAVVYTGRGAKRILSSSSPVLRESGLMDRAENYKDENAYIESKRKYVASVAALMRAEYKADWMVVESGTTGPDFFVPGVDRAFTYVGIAGPSSSLHTRLCRNSNTPDTLEDTRSRNMNTFTEFSLAFLRECLKEAYDSPGSSPTNNNSKM